MNEYDSNRMKDMLGESHDLTIVDQPEKADLILLNTNPLENIKNTLDISLVVKDGKVYEDPLKID